MIASIAQGLLIPFAGTSLGSACVFFLRKTLNKQIQRADWVRGRCSRASGRCTYDTCGRNYSAGASVPFKLCSGGNVVRSSGGTDSGNVRRQPFQHRNCLVCIGFFGYDDSRCCARVTGIRKNGVTN